MSTYHEIDSYGYCRWCNTKPTSALLSCPVSLAFQAWLNSPMGAVTVREVITPTETLVAKQAFAAGRRSTQ